MQGNSTEGVSSPGNPLRAIAASALEQIEEQGNRMGNRASWLPEIRGVAENSPSVLASLSPPAEHDLVSLKNAGSDSTRGPPEPHAPEEVQFKQPDLSHLYPSTSVTEIMLSRSKYRIDENEIKFIDDSCYHGGSAEVVPANLVNNRTFAGVKLAVKKFRIADDERSYDRAIMLLANELRYQSKLNHDNIIKLVGFSENKSNHTAWLVLPWMVNGNVREFLASRAWEIPERISLLYDVACGVEYLHSQKPPIRHGDLKSLNVLVNADNRALIADLKFARSLDMLPSPDMPHIMPPRTKEDSMPASGATVPPAASSPEITLTGEGFSLRWAAPEVLDERPLTLASNIWSFGWLCWEIITDELPFNDMKSHGLIIEKIVQGRVPSLSEVYDFSFIPRLRSLTEKCWRLDSKDRPSASACKDIISEMPRVIPKQLDVKAPSSQLLRVMGDMYVGVYRIPNGLNCITRALEIARTDSDDVETALALLSLGRIHYIRCDYAEAEEAFREAEALHARQGHRGGVGRAHRGLAQVYCVLGNYDGAASSLAEATEIFTGLKDDIGIADIIYETARLHKRRCEISKAKQLYIEAQAIYARARSPLGIAETTCGLAEVLALQCEFDLAESTYRKAADLYSEVGDTLGIARAKCGLGDIFCQKAVPVMAEKLYKEARDIIEVINPPLESANVLYGMGHVHRLQGNYMEAARYFYRASTIQTRIGDKLGAAETHYGMGDLYRMEDKYDSAATAYIEARDIFDVVCHRIGVADAMCGLAHVRRVQGRDEEAETLFNQAQGIYEEKEYEMGAATAALGLAAVYIERLEYEDASSAITKALGFSTRAKIPSLRARAFLMLALTYQGQQQIDKAIFYIGEAISVYAEIGDEGGALACQEILDEVRHSKKTSTS